MNETIISKLNSDDNKAVKKVQIEPTDEFIKVSRYLNVIFAYHNIPLTLVPFCLLLAQKMSFKTNLVYLLKSDKEELAEMLGVTEDRVKKMMRECVKYNIIHAVSRGKYEVNAYLFSTGSLVETRELQAHFDFQNEKFVVLADQKDLITGETVRKAVINRKDKQIEGQQSLFQPEYLGVDQKQEQAQRQKRKSQKKQQFNDFQQHNYDFDEIEKQLGL